MHGGSTTGALRWTSLNQHNWVGVRSPLWIGSHTWAMPRTVRSWSITTKLTLTANTLLRKFSHCSLEVKLKLFTLITCYSLYCNSVWSLFKVTEMSRVRVCHNDILKRLLGLPRWTTSSLALTRHGVQSVGVIRDTLCSAWRVGWKTLWGDCHHFRQAVVGHVCVAV